jgi:hypothetical protein
MVTNAAYKNGIDKKIIARLVDLFGSMDDVEAINLYASAKNRLYNWLNDQAAITFIKNVDDYDFVFRVGEKRPQDYTNGWKQRYHYFDVLDETDKGFYDEEVAGSTILKPGDTYGYEKAGYVLFVDNGRLGTPDKYPSQIFRSKQKTNYDPGDFPPDNPPTDNPPNNPPGNNPPPDDIPTYDVPQTSGFQIDTNTLFIIGAVLVGLYLLKGRR